MDMLGIRSKANSLVDEYAIYLNRVAEMRQKRRQQEQYLAQIEESRFTKIRKLEELRRFVDANAAGANQMANIHGRLSTEIGKLQEDTKDLSTEFDAMLVYPNELLEKFEQTVGMLCQRQKDFYKMSNDDEVFDAEVQEQSLLAKFENAKIDDLKLKTNERAVDLARIFGAVDSAATSTDKLSCLFATLFLMKSKE